MEIQEIPAIQEICTEMEWDIPFHWSTLKVYCDLLAPFAKKTDLLQGDQYPTVSLVFPTLLSLQKHTDASAGNQNFDKIGTLASDLRKELDQRFSTILVPSDPDFNPTFLAASVLDPYYSKFLPTEPINFFELGKDRLHELVVTYAQEHELVQYGPIFPMISGEAGDVEEVELSPIALSPLPTTSDADDDEFGNLMPTQISASFSASAPTIHLSPREVLENELLRDYYKSFLVQRFDPKSGIPKNALHFWEAHCGRFPELSKFAFELLSVPASSASIERAFSQTGISSAGRRSRIGADLLQAEAMLKVNRRFLK